MLTPTTNPNRSTGVRQLQLEVLESREVPAFLGELDPTFGTGGVASASSQMNIPGYPSSVVDSAGRTIILTTNAGMNGGMTVTRFDANGNLDSTFGQGGSATVLSGFIFVEGVAVDATGDIAALGTVGNGSDGVVAMFTPTGALDTSFGNNGILQISPQDGYTNFEATKIAFDAAGNIVIAGPLATSTYDPGVLRLTPTGAEDPTFNAGQVEQVNIGNNTYTNTEGLAIDPAGRILVAVGNADSFAGVVRLNPNGGIDTTFGNGGIAAIGSNDPIDAITTDPVGNVYFGSGGGGNGNPEFGKLTEAGTLDPTFGTGGIVQTSFLPNNGENQTIAGIAVTATGNLIAAVYPPAFFTQLPDLRAVIDLNPDGTLDPSFNAAGSLPGTNPIEFPGGNDAYIGVGLTPTGDIILTGFSATTSPSQLEVARLIGTGPGRPVDGGGSGNSGGTGTGIVVTTPSIPPQNPFASLGVSVRTAVGDVNGDGTPDTIFVTGPGTPLRVEVISGTDGSTVLVPAFDPFGDNFTGGAWVVAADFNHSGRDQIVIAADVGGGPQIVIWSLLPDGQMQEDASFYGITDPNFRGGTRIAVGDVNDDATPDLVVAAGYGGGPRVAVFDGTTLLSGNPTKLVNDFYVFQSSGETSLRNGLYVAVGDVNGDGYADLIFGAGIGGGPRVLVLSGKILIQDGAAAALAAPLANFFVGGSDSSRSGVAVAVTTDANDGVADIVAGLPAGTVSVPLVGQKGTMVAVYAGSTLTPDTQPTPAMSINPTTDPVLSGVFVE